MKLLSFHIIGLLTILSLSNNVAAKPVLSILADAAADLTRSFFELTTNGVTQLFELVNGILIPIGEGTADFIEGVSNGLLALLPNSQSLLTLLPDLAAIIEGLNIPGLIPDFSGSIEDLFLTVLTIRDEFLALIGSVDVTEILRAFDISNFLTPQDIVDALNDIITAISRALGFNTDLEDLIRLEELLQILNLPTLANDLFDNTDGFTSFISQLETFPFQSLIDAIAANDAAEVLAITNTNNVGTNLINAFRDNLPSIYIILQIETGELSELFAIFERLDVEDIAREINFPVDNLQTIFTALNTISLSDLSVTFETGSSLSPILQSLFINIIVLFFGIAFNSGGFLISAYETIDLENLTLLISQLPLDVGDLADILLNDDVGVLFEELNTGVLDPLIAAAIAELSG